MSSPNQKSIVFTFRLTREQRDALWRLAKQQNKKPSDFVRDLVFREIGSKAVAA